MMPTPKGLIYQLGDGAMILITRPYDENPATVGNGNMVAFKADNKEQVAHWHAKALALGGTCDGAPGTRGGFGEFAYFRDVDGNKLAAFCLGCCGRALRRAQRASTASRSGHFGGPGTVDIPPTAMQN